MPQDKSFLFTKKNQLTSSVAKALSHPARLNIIQLLEGTNFLIHKEIEENIPLSAGTISQHLDTLIKIKIVTKDEFYGAVGYRLDKEGWLIAKQCIRDFFTKIK